MKSWSQNFYTKMTFGRKIHINVNDLTKGPWRPKEVNFFFIFFQELVPHNWLVIEKAFCVSGELLSCIVWMPWPLASLSKIRWKFVLFNSFSFLSISEFLIWLFKKKKKILIWSIWTGQGNFRIISPLIILKATVSLRN